MSHCPTIKSEPFHRVETYLQALLSCLDGSDIACDTTSDDD